MKQRLRKAGHDDDAIRAMTPMKRMRQSVGCRHCVTEMKEVAN
jgi:hypothetical protein